MKLLDSIYRNFYVPPVVFVVLKDEDGEEVRKCVDGKQRLTSIQKFFDGQVREHAQHSTCTSGVDVRIAPCAFAQRT